MATGKRIYGSRVWIEGDAVPTWTTLSGTTEEFSDTIDNTSNGYDKLDIWPMVNFDGTPTDDVDINVYSSPDGVDWDDPPLASFRIGKETDPSQVPVPIFDPPPYLRIGFQQTGATDSHDVRASYVGSRWDIT